MQNVKLAGRGLTEATWSIQPASTPGCRLTVHAERGRAILEVDPATGEWALSEPDGTRVAGDRNAAVRGLLDEFAELTGANAVENGSSPTQEPAPAQRSSPAGRSSAVKGSSPVEWSDLVKAFETVDATHRSVKRRRTIELHFEPMSERAIFKTQMTAIGCGVLMGTLLLMLVYLAVASTIPLPRPALFVLRGLVFAPVGVFLLLQLLYPLARPSSHEGTANDSEHEPSVTSGEVG